MMKHRFASDDSDGFDVVDGLGQRTGPPLGALHCGTILVGRAVDAVDRQAIGSDLDARFFTQLAGAGLLP